LEIAVEAEKLNDEGKHAALKVIRGMETEYPLAPNSSKAVE
jgi:hypothetical protein